MLPKLAHSSLQEEQHLGGAHETDGGEKGSRIFLWTLNSSDSTELSHVLGSSPLLAIGSWQVGTLCFTLNSTHTTEPSVICGPYQMISAQEERMNEGTNVSISQSSVSLEASPFMFS